VESLNWFLNPSLYTGNYISWQQMYHHDVVYYCPGRHPLYYAIELQLDSLVSLLLPVNGQVDILVRGVSPLHVAARCGAIKTARKLLDLGASVDFRSSKDPEGITSLMTALHFAAEGGHADVIQLLLQYGASPHAINESGSSPFLRATRSGSLKAMKVLYDAGSDIDAQKKGFTPLFESVAHCRRRVACQLLYWGADPTIVSRLHGNGATTLTLLAAAYYETEATKLRESHPDDEEKNFQVGIEDFWVYEVAIHKKILELRSQGAGPEAFQPLFSGLRRQWILIKQMEKDTRPGTEREKDYRWYIDVRAHTLLRRNSLLTVTADNDSD